MSRLLWAGVMLALTAIQAAAQAPPPMAEVRELLRAKLDGVEPADIDAETVDGLLHDVLGRAFLLPEGAAAPDYKDEPGLPAIAHTALFDDQFAYVRIGRFVPETAVELERKLAELKRGGPLRGLVLDLRFSMGRDFAAAAAVVDLFLETAQPLWQWKNTVVKSSAKPNPVRLPLVVLVNQGTRGAGEVLAAVVRDRRLGVVIGQTTAGQAMEITGFKLSNRQTLMIATAQVRLTSGKLLLGGRCQPDITVPVAEADQQAFLANPYASPAAPPNGGIAAMTNRVGRTRLTEAELVRQRREETGGDSVRETRAAPAARPEVRDPVLARGLDLLKGLQLLKNTAPS